ncbi:MAG: flavodoxin-dependent (E)-4-hydroxy-3-methylbut-2-enyl-diphosphate synthase, partial [Erysipelotrichaceae bacterium]|nr:flavodoxin-dependent (E)-4-hydroxy-3-methylbut-2-enyl-diphosphate synthase [Erysipelotrichaceae bacterium]
MFTRMQTKQIKVKDLFIGHQNRCVIQSMTNTKTRDVEATVAQAKRLINAGCEIIRVAVTCMEDAQAIAQIKQQIDCPIVADIHFDHKLALACIEAGVDKIRINPGNIGSEENVEKVVRKCQEKHIPIRIGINSGSIEKEIIAKYGKVTAEGMIESAQKHIDILEKLGFYDTCLSFKSSDVMLTIQAYRLAAQ